MANTRKLGLHERYGGLALVTGAAAGIGKAFATHLAAEGFDLLLVDREDAATQSLAESLRLEWKVDARALVYDLSAPDVAERASSWATDHDIGLLVNNAGISPLGRFLDIPLDQHVETLDVNCRATLALTHVIGNAMATRGRGGIIVLSSVSALSGSAYFSHYAATKGYGLNLACGLWSELDGSGVDVLAVCPGMTDTKPVQDRNFLNDIPFYVPVADPDSVAKGALRALGTRPATMTTLSDRMSALLTSKLLPRSWTLSIIKRSIERMRS